MSAPGPSRGALLIGLLALILVPLFVPQIPLVLLLETFAITLLAAEVNRTGGVLAVRLVKLAVRFVPSEQRADAEAEWTDHVRSAGEHGLRPLWHAASITRMAISTALVSTARRELAIHLGISMVGYWDMWIFVRELLPMHPKRRYAVFAFSVANLTTPVMFIPVVRTRVPPRWQLVVASLLYAALSALVTLDPASMVLKIIALAPYIALPMIAPLMVLGRFRPGHAKSMMRRIRGGTRSEG